jgi:acetyl esterase/lipase
MIGWFDGKFLPSTYFRDHYFYIIPSYRGEALTVPTWGTWISEGQKSKADFDVDDAITFARIMGSETSFKFWYGQSRGGTVALLATIRGYATKTAELFGGTDCYLDYVRADIEKYLYRHVIPTERVSALVLQEAVLPLIWGQIDMPTARLEMLRRSPAYFASEAEPCSLHHGLADPLVDWIQTQAMETALTAAGIVNEAEYYQNGIHDPDTLPGCGAKVEIWLQ